MKKLKVMTVIGTRPEIIRLSRIIAKLDKYCHHILVHTGQNYDYELNEIFLSDLNIRKPDFFLNAAGNTSSETIGKIIISINNVFEQTRPDALLVLGDTNSCLAVISAKRWQIPIFHIEAGNRCFDQRVPEEINRRIIDHIADINLTYSSIAREYLLSEGFPADRIIKIGSPMFEVLSSYKKKFEQSNIVERLGLQDKKYFVVSTHREENIDSDSNLLKLVGIFNTIAKIYGDPIIISTHPRTQKRIIAMNVSFHPLIKLLKPLGFSDYIKLQVSARAVLSDSGTITEESSILDFPALNIREVHERPEGFEEAAVMMVGLEVDRVLQGLNILSQQGSDNSSNLRIVSDYAVPNVSEKIIRIIYSYTDYVNRVVWKK
ncbi:MAG: UDP-N-acetylglucosamine 2-epimerase (non-hydrolyzing) [Coxiellaceae bacterium]|jgi:UDP-N-acetylglucosamine 2-epimerase (non-hydrolysing)|nr:UDP-N-acetylglucosamine 2-epimerase (non-hydrolyzing) [Coxiellaceae bacterium]